MPARASHAAEEESLSPLAGWCATAAVSLLLFIAVLPHLGVIASSFAERWFFTILPTEITTHYYADVFTDRLTSISIANSLLYSGLSTFLDLILGLVIAHLLAREVFPGKSLLDAMAMLPLVLPGLVLAFGLLITFRPPWPNWMNPRVDPTFLLVISYALRRLPYIVRAAYAGYQQTSISLEEASYNLGAGRWLTFRRVTLPLIAPNLIAGSILTFCFAMLEVSDSLILAMESRFAPITRAFTKSWDAPVPIPPVWPAPWACSPWPCSAAACSSAPASWAHAWEVFSAHEIISPCHPERMRARPFSFIPKISSSRSRRT